MKIIAKSIPEPSLRRLPCYLEELKKIKDAGEECTSCQRLGEILKQDPTQIRKDLAAAGAEGRPKSGYGVSDLIKVIEEFLGWDNLNEAFLAGAGNLGMALMGHEGFERQGLKIVAAFDVSAEKIGREICGIQILPVDKLAKLARRMRVKIGILTVPAGSAQKVADMMVGGGIGGIWNFTQERLKLPPEVIVERVDLPASFAVLYGKLNSNSKSN